MHERRQSSRRRTLLSGRIEIERLNGWAVDCAVRNVGAGGVRVTMPAHVVVPPRFELRVSGGAPVPARLVWYAGGQAGIALAP